MSNPFDQFDEKNTANPFDQFNTPTVPPVPTLTQTQPVQPPVTATVQERDPLIPSGDTDTRPTDQYNADIRAEGASDIPLTPSGDTDTRSTAEYARDQDVQSIEGPFNAAQAYDGIPFRDAVQVYNERLQGENVTRYGPANLFGILPAYETAPDGSRTFITPPATDVLNPFNFGNAKPDRISMAGAGLMTGAGYLAELGAAGIDAVRGTDTAVESVQGFFPKTNTEGDLGGTLITEGVPILVAGGGVGAPVLKALSMAPRIIRGAAAYIAGETAASAVSPSDSGSLFVGENAMLPIFKGLDIDNPDEAEKILQDRLNLLVGGLMEGGVVTRAVGGTVAASKLAWDLSLGPLVNLSRAERSIENRAVQQIFDQLGAYRPGMSPQEAAEFRRNLTNTIEANRTVLLERLDNVDENIKVKMDTLGAALRGVDTPEAQDLFGLIQSVRQGMITSNRPLTSARTRLPQAELDTQTEQFLRQSGGETTAEQNATMFSAADEFAEQGRSTVRAAQTTAEEARQIYNEGLTNFINRIGEDIELTDEIQAVARARGTEITIPRDASRDQIMEQLQTSYRTMVDAKNGRYAAISGGPIDTRSLYDALANVNIDELSTMASTLKRSSPLRNIVELFQPQFRDPQGNVVSRELVPFDPNTPDTVPAGFSQETRDQVVERVNGWFARDSDMYNFGFFHNTIRPELSQLSSDLFNSQRPGDTSAGGVVRQIIRTIDTNMVDFVSRTDPSLANDALEAKRYYTEEFAPFWRDGRLEDFADLYDSTIGRSNSSVQIQPTNFGRGSLNIVQNTIQEANRFDIQQFRNLLDRPEAGADSAALADYMVLDAVGSMAKAIRASDIEAVPIDDLTDNLRQYSDALNRVFPERAEELNAFIRRVESAQGDLAAQRTIMEEAETTVTAAKEAIQESALSNFFRGFPDETIADPMMRDLATSSNAFPAFERVFRNGRDSYDLVDTLMTRIDNAPEGQREILRAGMNTAYAKYVRNMVTNRVQIPGDIQATSAAQTDAALDGTNPVFFLGDRIFKDKPEVMRALRGLSEFARDSTRSRNAPPIAGQSPTAFNQNVAASTNRIIYATMGPLTRAGTRLRALVSAGVEAVDPTSLSVRIMDEILSDPERFVSIARRIEQNPRDPQLQQLMAITIMRGLTRPFTGEDEDPIGAVVDGAVNLETQMRDALP